MYDPNSQTFLVDRLFNKPKLDIHFQTRLAANLSVIRNNFLRLYGQREDLNDQIGKLVDVLSKAYSDRDKALKKSDLERERQPDWFVSEQIAGMMFYVDRFCGDLPTLRQKLDYFEELGINLLHVMPVLESPAGKSDGGYAVSNYRKVDSRYGAMSDVNGLAKDLHRKGMYLMMDMVVNHTSEEHEWAKKAKAGDRQYQDYFYCYEDRNIPDQFEWSLPQVFPETAPGNFTYNEEMGKWVMTVFNNYQWDLNYTNPTVLIEMIDVILFLANQGIDVIRLDALAFMWKRIGTDSQNLDEAHILVQTMKACTQIVAPGTIFLAEAIVAPHQIVRYFGQTQTVSNECDIAYNATLMTLLWDSVATKSNKLISVSLDQIPRKPRGTTWLNYVRCHDDIGLGYEDGHAQMAGYDAWSHRGFLTNFLTGRIDWSFARGLPFMEDKSNGTARISGSLASLVGLERALHENDKAAQELAIKRIILLHSIIISFGGIPLLYAGDELATLNDYAYQQNEEHKHDNRWVHRPRMDWKRADLRKKKGTVEHQVFQSLSQLLKIRKDSPEFADNDNCHLINCHNEHLFGYVRVSDNERTFAVANLNDHPESLYLDLMINLGFDMRAGVRDKVRNTALDFSNYELRLEPYEFYWITQQ